MGPMDLQAFIQNVSEFSDLELAVLLSLIAKQSCLFYVDDDLVDDLASELALIVSTRFKLSSVILDPRDLQSAEVFGRAIIDENRNFADEENNTDQEAPVEVNFSSRLLSVDLRAAASRSSRVDYPKLDNRMVVNVVIAKDFNAAHNDVQVSVLELIRRRRIFSRTTVHPVPSEFLFFPIIAASTQRVRLNPHLNDRIFISHYHESTDGFRNLEETGASQSSTDNESLRSVRRLSHGKPIGVVDTVPQEIINQLRLLGESTTITVEMRRYIQDIITFLRLERGVDTGVSPYATVMLIELVRCLAPLHGVDFVTPSLVALAIKKIYPHRIIIAEPKRERSMQYGSNLEVVKQYLAELTPEYTTQAALIKVDCPL